MRNCDAGTKAAWDAHMDIRLQRLFSRFPSHPVVLVGQSFRHTNKWDWPLIPAPCQLEWWYQLALANPGRIPGMLWFAYDYNLGPPEDPFVDGLKDPAHSTELARITEIFVRNYQNKL